MSAVAVATVADIAPKTKSRKPKEAKQTKEAKAHMEAPRDYSPRELCYKKYAEEYERLYKEQKEANPTKNSLAIKNEIRTMLWERTKKNEAEMAELEAESQRLIVDYNKRALEQNKFSSVAEEKRMKKEHFDQLCETYGVISATNRYRFFLKKFNEEIEAKAPSKKEKTKFAAELYKPYEKKKGETNALADQLDKDFDEANLAFFKACEEHSDLMKALQDYENLEKTVPKASKRKAETESPAKDASSPASENSEEESKTPAKKRARSSANSEEESKASAKKRVRSSAKNTK